MTAPHGFRKRFPVRFADVDYARVVYFPREIHWLHLVMEDFFREEVGIPYSEMLEKDRIGFPTVRLEMDFSSPLRFGDEGDVTLRLHELGRRRRAFPHQLPRAPTGRPAPAPIG